MLPTNIYFFDHVRWLRWAARAQGVEVLVELESMRAFLRKDGAHWVLHPQFLTLIDGQPRYVWTFADSATHFAGWRPQQAVNGWPASTDKLVFKRAANKLGLKVPEFWLNNDHDVRDVVVKRAVGSFGQQVHGPYRSGAERPLRIEQGEYYERFIAGDLLKVWFWGGSAVGLECDPMPGVTGDGRSTLRQLLTQRVSGGPLSADGCEAMLARCATVLAYDGRALDTVLPDGQPQRAEFRYGSSLMSRNERQVVDLRGQVDPQWRPLQEIAPLLLQLIPEALHPGALFGIDAVRDADGQIWLLEMNSNPFMNPLAYEPMLATLLAQRTGASTPALAEVL